MDISLTPIQRRLIEKLMKTGQHKTEAQVIDAALQQMAAREGQPDALASLASLPGPSGSEDIEALAFVVMMEAAKSAQEDLKEIMAEVKAMTNGKAKLRDLINKVNRDVTANAGCDADVRKLDFSRGLGSEPAYHRAPMPVLDPDTEAGVRLKPCDLYRGKILRYEQLLAIRDGLKDQLDSLSEMSEMTSLRLQMAMDRRSKFMQTLSNIMKKISSTEDTLVQNLK
jgi:hypothetical protein